MMHSTENESGNKRLSSRGSFHHQGGTRDVISGLSRSGLNNVEAYRSSLGSMASHPISKRIIRLLRASECMKRLTFKGKTNLRFRRQGVPETNRKSNFEGENESSLSRKGSPETKQKGKSLRAQWASVFASKAHPKRTRPRAKRTRAQSETAHERSDRSRGPRRNLVGFRYDNSVPKIHWLLYSGNTSSLGSSE